jgi:hypothetical protein
MIHVDLSSAFIVLFTTFMPQWYSSIWVVVLHLASEINWFYISWWHDHDPYFKCSSLPLMIHVDLSAAFVVLFTKFMPQWYSSTILYPFLLMPSMLMLNLSQWLYCTKHELTDLYILMAWWWSIFQIFSFTFNDTCWSFCSIHSFVHYIHAWMIYFYNFFPLCWCHACWCWIWCHNSQRKGYYRELHSCLNDILLQFFIPLCWCHACWCSIWCHNSQRKG